MITGRFFKKDKGKDNIESNYNKRMLLSEDIAIKNKDRLKDWITFYRLNVELFVYHYMGVKLYPYQKTWIHLMNINDTFVAIAARSSAKSWLIGVYCIARAILWPRSEIVLVSETQKQASLIITEKIESLRNQYVNIGREILKTVMSPNECCVYFKNGSKIKVASSKEGGRGNRATVTIFEEFRLMDKEMVDTVVRPFSYCRQAPFMLKKEYTKKFVEEPKEIYISSSHYKQHWWFDLTRLTMAQAIAGKNSGVVFFDYVVSLYHGLITKRQIQNKRRSMTSESFDMEYRNLILGAGEKSYFNLQMFSKARKLSFAVYPQRIETYNPKKNPYDILKRVDGEIRILSFDVAMRTGAKNDNTILCFIRLLPQLGKGYLREVLYIESHNGMNSITQALRAKQLIEDFSIDVLVLDVQNVGITILDMLGTLTKDPERGKEYDPLTVMNHPTLDPKTFEEYSKRCLSKNGRAMIYPISATPKLNSDIAVMLRDRLKKKMFSFLITESSAEEILIKKKEFLMETRNNPELRAFYLAPFVQQSLMITECLGLDASLVNGNIKLDSKNNARKDRYTALAYGNYYASFLDPDLMIDQEEEDDWDILQKVVWFG